MANSKTWLSFVLLLASHVSLGYGLWETSSEKQNYDDQNVFKKPNPTSSYDLERDRRGGFSMPSFRHFVGHGYKTPTSKETRKSTLSKDIAEVDKFGLENRKWYVSVGFGDGSSGGGSTRGGGGSTRGGGNDNYGGRSGYEDSDRDSNGGGNRGYRGGNRGGHNSGNGYGGGRGYDDGHNSYSDGGDPLAYGGGYPWTYAGGIPWGEDTWTDLDEYEVYEYSNEPMSYKDASVMRHHNMGKLSKNDHGASRASQAEKTGMKNGGKIQYDGVPRMEDTGEEKKNN